MTLAYSRAGQGPPLLLLNGGLMSHAAWEPVAAPLRDRYSLVGCDLRGQLLSPGPAPAGIEGHVADIVELLDGLGIDGTHLAGTSFGAEVALLLAARHPARILSLAAITATDRILPEVWAAAQPVVAAARDAALGGDGGRVFDLLLPGTFSPAFVAAQGSALAERRRTIAALPKAWFLGVAGLLASLEGLDLRGELAAIRCPTAVVAAERDLTFPLERSRALCAGIAGAELVVVEGCGHALVAEAPHRLVEILGGFLARVDKEVSS